MQRNNVLLGLLCVVLLGVAAYLLITQTGSDTGGQVVPQSTQSDPYDF